MESGGGVSLTSSAWRIPADPTLHGGGDMERIERDGAVLEYAVEGVGEPVLLIHPSVTADGLAGPLFQREDLGFGQSTRESRNSSGFAAAPDTRCAD